VNARNHRRRVHERRAVRAGRRPRCPSGRAPRTVDSVEERAGRGRSPDPRDEGRVAATSRSPGGKIPTVAKKAPQPPPTTYRRTWAVVKTGPRCHLADGHRVEELRLGEPVEAVDEIAAEEREEHVPAPEHRRSDLQEGQKEGEQAGGGRSGSTSSRRRARGARRMARRLASRRSASRRPRSTPRRATRPAAPPRAPRRCMRVRREGQGLST